MAQTPLSRQCGTSSPRKNDFTIGKTKLFGCNSRDTEELSRSLQLVGDTVLFYNPPVSNNISDELFQFVKVKKQL